MKNRILMILVCSIFSANFLFSQQDFQRISGITTDNYPRVDGSTATNPLNIIIAAKLLDLEYKWISVGGINDVYFPSELGLPSDFKMKIACSQTHNAIINVINNYTDLIIVPKMSEAEKEYADNAGVSLIETPIALDALDFVYNAENAVNSLSVEQIQNIYLGNITNWKEVGGADEAIIPYIRNANSGSQTMMNEIVMNNTGMPDWEVSYADELRLGSMILVYNELRYSKNGICFTPHYYKEYMVADDVFGKENIKTFAINGIMPDKNSIENKTYPFVSNVYVTIRSDLDKNSMAYKLYEWLQTPSGKSVIAESGYVPYKSGENSIKQISNQHIQIIPNSTEGTIEIRGIEDYSNLNYAVYNLFGRMIQNGNLKQTIDLSSQKGLNVLTIMQNQQVIAREKVIVR